MQQHFEHIIWGASVKGIRKAIDLRQKGTQVLLLNKFGFPGGKMTESLSLCWKKTDIRKDPFLSHIFKEADSERDGILFQNEKDVIFHAEAIKKILWKQIQEYQIDTLFHVVPYAINEADPTKVTLFGKAGKMAFSCDAFSDLSDDFYLDIFRSATDFQKVHLKIHCFLKCLKYINLHELVYERMIITKLGAYMTFPLNPIDPVDSIEELNHFLTRIFALVKSDESSCSFVIPSTPEIVIPKNDE